MLETSGALEMRSGAHEVSNQFASRSRSSHVRTSLSVGGATPGDGANRRGGSGWIEALISLKAGTTVPEAHRVMKAEQLEGGCSQR